MRVMKAISPFSGIAALGLVLALNRCQGEANANLKAGGETTPPPAPTPTEVAAPPPTPAPAPAPKLVSTGKIKLEGHKVTLPGEVEFDFNKSSIKNSQGNTDILTQLQQFL